MPVGSILSVLARFFAPPGSDKAKELNRPTRPPAATPLPPRRSPGKQLAADVEDYAAAILAGKRGAKDPRGNFGTPNNPFDKGEEREFFGSDIMAEFLRGGSVLWCQSSWVDYARYWPQKQELEVGFQDGWVSIYGPGADVRMAESFAKAGSKGKWLHSHIKTGYMPDGRHWTTAIPQRGS